ncbi:hypothetical protein PAMP_009896 [Pampus punctatissimus]
MFGVAGSVPTDTTRTAASVLSAGTEQNRYNRPCNTKHLEDKITNQSKRRFYKPEPAGVKDLEDRICSHRPSFLRCFAAALRPVTGRLYGVSGGYRSPARVTVIFLAHCEQNNVHIKAVCPPENCFCCSEDELLSDCC